MGRLRKRKPLSTVENKNQCLQWSILTRIITPEATKEKLLGKVMPQENRCAIFFAVLNSFSLTKQKNFTTPKPVNTGQLYGHFLKRTFFHTIAYNIFRLNLA